MRPFALSFFYFSFLLSFHRHISFSLPNSIPIAAHAAFTFLQKGSTNETNETDDSAGLVHNVSGTSLDVGGCR